MPAIRRLGRVSAGLAPVVLTLVLAGCADDRPASRNTPLQPGTQGSGEPDFALLWNAGPETARLSDELAAFVERAFYRANGGTNAAPPTSGVLQEGPAGNFTWQPGAPGGPFIVRTLAGREVTLTIHAANGGWQSANIGFSSPYDGRETQAEGLAFDVTILEPGSLDLRLRQEWLPAGDPRLTEADGAYDWIDVGDGFERVLGGSWTQASRTMTVTATHRGGRLVGPHIFLSEEALAFLLEGPDGHVTGTAVMGFSGGENFYAPGGTGGIGWLLEQNVTHSTGGVAWELVEGALSGYLQHAVWYWPLLVPEGGGWMVGGEIRRNGVNQGRFAYRALVQPQTTGEPVVAMQGGVFEVVQPAGRPAPVSLFDDPFIED
jgi:hypothetical protein